MRKVTFEDIGRLEGREGGLSYEHTEGRLRVHHSIKTYPGAISSYVQDNSPNKSYIVVNLGAGAKEDPYLDSKNTLYMTAKQAIELGNLLLKSAAELEDPFVPVPDDGTEAGVEG